MKKYRVIYKYSVSKGFESILKSVDTLTDAINSSVAFKNVRDMIERTELNNGFSCIVQPSIIDASVLELTDIEVVSFYDDLLNCLDF